jgi:hypothetical protein
MPMSGKQKEKLLDLGRQVAAMLGGGLILCTANLLQLMQIVRGEVFVVLAFLVGILVGMMSTELPHAIVSGFLAYFAGVLTFYGFIFLSVGGSLNPLIAEASLEFATFSIIRVLLFSFFAEVLVGPVVGRIIGPQWYAPQVGKHELRVPLPEKRET